MTQKQLGIELSFKRLAAQNGALPVGGSTAGFLVRYRWALTALWYLAVVAGAMFGLGTRLLWMF